MKNKYRIVRTGYPVLKYAVEKKYWFFPIWLEWPVKSMCKSVEECEQWIRDNANKVVKEYTP